jgi:uncharacterized protein YrrD
MLFSTQELKGYTIHATDGELGKVEQLFFDDQQWTIRNLVVKTGNWFNKKEVLISPISVQSVLKQDRSLVVSLTKEQVKNSPNIDTEQPVSRIMEMRYYDYYRWPYYWSGPQPWGLASYPTGMLARPYSIPSPEYRPGIPASEMEALTKTHLRSSKAVVGYQVGAIDSHFGRVKDLLFEDESWTIRYLAIETSHFFSHRSVLISPAWVTSISWTDERINVELSRSQIQSSPKYFSHELVDRDYEKLLYRHYSRPNYWGADSEFEVTKSPRQKMP